MEEKARCGENNSGYRGLGHSLLCGVDILRHYVRAQKKKPLFLSVMQLEPWAGSHASAAAQIASRLKKKTVRKSEKKNKRDARFERKKHKRKRSAESGANAQ